MLQGLRHELVAQDGADAGRETTRIDIRFPAESEPEIAVEPGERFVTLTLPRGSQFPLDFAGASGGLGTIATGGAGGIVLGGASQSAAATAAQQDGERSPTVRVKIGEPIASRITKRRRLPRAFLSTSIASCTASSARA